MNFQIRNSIFPMMIGFFIGGCAVGPDFHSPEPLKPEHYSNELRDSDLDAAERPKLVARESIPQQWWQMYESEGLSQLVKRGLSNSPTLAAAKARLKSAQETLDADTSFTLFPKVGASLNSSRRKISGATFGNAGNPRIFAVHNASVDVSYTVDAFGGGQRYLELGKAKVEFEALQLEASRQSLIANIVTAAIAEASLREQIEATKAMISDETSLLNLSEKKFEIGVIAKADLLAQRTSLAQTRTLLPALQKALAQMRHQLAMLTGVLPDNTDLPKIEMAKLVLPAEIPITLPSTLTQRRPDVRAAEASLHQANAQVGVATSNLYPKLALSASYGTEVIKIADLFNAGSAIWGMAAGLTQPIFRAGELRARKRVAMANFDQAAALYRQSVLSAFVDVADAMLAIEMDGRQLVLQQQAGALAVETLGIVREQHKQGVVSYLGLLDAQKRYQQTRINLIKARAAMLNDSAALIFSLGGDWQQKTTEQQTTENQL